ncbi:MAG: hypothetical protein KC619_13870 [Myxococcales bacterium]|nr:hypothetical protein [Myxococcales bacterium]
MSRAALVLLSCSTLMGCILTRSPTYDAPANTPPVVLEDPDFPMNRFVNVYLEELAAAGETQVRFAAQVRDPDIDDELVGLVFLDRNPNSTTNVPIIENIDIPATGEADRDDVSFAVDVGELDPGAACRVLELHVSRGFVGFANPMPAPDVEHPEGPIDLGRGIWFLRVLRNREDTQALLGCDGS